MSGLKPVCVNCNLFFKPEKNGIHFEEGYQIGDTGKWGSYKLWVGDKWKCRGCGAEIIVGTPLDPVMLNHEPSYTERRAQFAPELRVDDC